MAYSGACTVLLLTPISGWLSDQHSFISSRRPGFNSPLDQQNFNFPYSPSNPSWVTKPFFKTIDLFIKIRATTVVTFLLLWFKFL